MTNLNLKNIRKTYGVVEGPKGYRSSLVSRAPHREGGNFVEVSKVGTKFSKKINMPKKQNILTEFKSRFMAKQAIKNYYGSLSENSLNILRKNSEVISSKGSVICVLEKRLDVLIFRLGFASSIYEARSFIKSGLVKINDKIVHGHSNNKSVNVGSKISVDITKLTYLAKIKHLKFNFTNPSGSPLGQKGPLTGHLICPITHTASGALEGYLVHNPLESEVFLPAYSFKNATNFPINKFH